ncbi:BnaA03g54010D [Brassica napus]|uniref:BnaA03g54010D protein n=2 Tax=Brassica TaxID=3705 RepID=A0A078GVN0_BRANA|nr:BnaA03g54010D [Brassica napus]VDC84359.1 unnamed protein product [Brassica rapa]
MTVKSQLSMPFILEVQVGAPEMRESSDIKDLISYGYDLINLLNSKNGVDVMSRAKLQPLKSSPLGLR